MIIGVVNAKLEATPPLQIEDAQGHLHPIEVIIDTGFTGAFTLKPSQIAALGLPSARPMATQTGVGSIHMTNVYRANLPWDSHIIQVAVQEVDTAPLLGTRLLAGHELKAHFVPGGAVTVTHVP